MKIVFLEPLGIPEAVLDEAVRAQLGNAAELVYYPDRKTDTETLVQRCEGADAVVLSNFPFRAEVMERCPKLKMVCVAFTGVDHVDIDYCRSHGITVSNCAGYSTVAVADLVFGLVIGLARNILPCDARCRAGGTKDGLVGFELEGKTFGVIGTGAIGSRVCRIANAFGCRVLAWSRTKKELSGVEYVELDTLLRESDIVSLHVPQTKETIGLIGEAELSKMKKSAFLINTARGPVVKSEALAAALRSGTIAGAGVDVFDKEPPLDTADPLLNAPNLLCTPHVAFATRQAFEKRAVIVGKNLAAFMAGEPVNKIC